MTARFNFMHFMPYTHLPRNHKEFPSLWVNFPNKYYDPHKAAALYERYLDEFEYADKVGFDAIVVNEHHNTAYSMMPAPNLIAATLLPRVKNARICVWGTPPNLEYPNRLAEEYAMLDVMSGRTAGSRVPAWHGHGILGESGQSGHRPRAPQGVDRDHPEGLDQGRPDQLTMANSIPIDS